MLWSLLLLLSSRMKSDRILAVLFIAGFGMLRASVTVSQSQHQQPLMAAGPSCTSNTSGLPACNFDASWCGVYSNQSSTEEDGGLVWKRGHSVTINTGGGGKPTTIQDWHPSSISKRSKKKVGSFAYLDVGNTEVPVGSKSRLNAQIPSDDVGAVCIEIHYVTTTTVDAPEPAAITVINRVKGEPDHVIGEVKDDTKGQWKIARFHSCVGFHSIIAFESEKMSDNSMVGLDYVNITRSNMDCSRFPAYCTDSTNGTPACNFDNGMCGYYKTESMDQYGLTWKRGKNYAQHIPHDWSPPNRKPNAIGQFMYLDISDPNIPLGAKARLNGQITNPALKAVCVEMRYFIATDNDGISPTITVINKKKDNTERKIATISGDTRGQWKKAQFHFCVGELSTIAFESDKISPHYFVGLDYIKVTRSDMECHFSTPTSPSTIATTTTTTTQTTPTTTPTSTTQTTPTSTTQTTPTSTTQTTPTTTTTQTTPTITTTQTIPTTTPTITTQTTPTSTTQTTSKIPTTETTPTTTTTQTTPTTDITQTTPTTTTTQTTPTTTIIQTTPTTTTTKTTPTSLPTSTSTIVHHNSTNNSTRFNYTTALKEKSTSDKKDSVPIPIIAGSVAGIALCFLILVAITIVLKRRRARALGTEFKNLYATDDDSNLVDGFNNGNSNSNNSSSSSSSIGIDSNINSNSTDNYYSSAAMSNDVYAVVSKNRNEPRDDNTITFALRPVSQDSATTPKEYHC